MPPMRDGRTTTREDRATQLLICETLSLAMIKNHHLRWMQHCIGQKCDWTELGWDGSLDGLTYRTPFHAYKVPRNSGNIY